MGEVLCGGGAVQSLTGHRRLDVLAPARKRHYLLARVSPKLPTPVCAGHIDAIAESLYFARKLRAIHRRCKALRAVYFDRIEPAPRAVGTYRHVGDHDVGMQMRVGAVAIIGAL